MMIIRFTKRAYQPDLLTCIRADGSCTWAENKPGTTHDLIHYAVETTLGYTQAFFGLVALSRDIDSFGTQQGRKDIYTQEESWTEAAVSLLQFPEMSGSPLTDDEFYDQLAQYFAYREQPAPTITQQQLTDIRAAIYRLHKQWASLPAGGTLELRFTPVSLGSEVQ